MISTDKNAHGDTIIAWFFALLYLILTYVTNQYSLVVLCGAFVILNLIYKRRILLSIPAFSSLLLVIIVIGFFMGIYNDQFLHARYDFVKDLLAFSAPIACWLVFSGIGARISDSGFLWTIVFITSGLSGTLTLIMGVPDMLHSFTYYTFRPNDFVIFGIILFFVRPEGWKWVTDHAHFAMLICAINFVVAILTLSRTTLLSLIICLIVLGLRNFKAISRTIKVMLILAAGIIVAVDIVPNFVADGFLGKITNSLSEISASHQQWNDASITINWRGYEKYCAEGVFAASPLYIQLFGNGFGYLLDVGNYAYLVTSESGLALLHDGYWTVILKSGIIGCVSYFAFYFMNIYASFKGMRKAKGQYEYALVCACFVCMLINTFTVQGFFTFSAFHAFLIPAAVISGYLQKDRYKKTVSCG